MFVKVTRTCEIKVPLEMAADSATDWTHFTHLHRRSHYEFRLLHKEGNREIFLYKGRMIYPLPFYRTFIVFREYLPEQKGYRQYYLHVRSGKVHHLDTRTIADGELSKIIGVFHFSVAKFWKAIPRIFIKLFRLRMRRVKAEDDAWLRERLRVGAFENPACAPRSFPEHYNLMDDFISQGIAGPELELEDYIRSGE